MSDIEIKIDPELLAEFLDESIDSLSSLDPRFVKLEAAPSDLTLVNEIFRPIHSIKGSAPFFGLMRVKALSHEIESLLDLLRKKRLPVDRPVIDVLLASVDELKSMLERVRQDQPEVMDEAKIIALLEDLKSIAADTAALTASLWREVFSKLEDLRKERKESDESLCAYLDKIIFDLRKLAAREDSLLDELWFSAPKPAQRIKKLLGQPFEGLLSDEESSAVLEALEELIEVAKDLETEELLKDLREKHQACIASVGFDSLLRELIMEKLSELVKKNVWKAAGPEAEPSEHKERKVAAPSGKAESRPASPGQPGTKKTMRVSEASIDTFLAYVGELLVVGDMFTHLQKKIAKEDAGSWVLSDLRRTMGTFDNLSNNLRKSIMTIRKVPVRSLLQKVPRTVRDIASEAGKDIGVEIAGEELEIDKSLISLLDAPLIHMVRNAADHGIEPPDQREAEGKPRQGLVRVDVYETDTNLVLEVEDDGRGLDYAAIRAKAEESNFVKRDRQLSDEEIINLIFSSGVSTSQKVSDVSGRGVGMDVVKKAIDAVGGVIKVSSQPGQGSRFQVVVPKSVTTQIMSGFLVSVSGQIFILPMDRIQETIKVEQHEINTVTGKGRCVIRHDQVLPMLPLADLLEISSSGPKKRDYETVVSVTSRSKLFGLSVDEVLGVQKLVSREIEGLGDDIGFVTGGALLGDGSVALILDLDCICMEES